MAANKITQVQALEILVNVITGSNQSYPRDVVQMAIDVVNHMIDVKKTAISKKSNTVSKATIANKELAVTVRDYIIVNGGVVTRKEIVTNVTGVTTAQKLTAVINTTKKYASDLGFSLIVKHDTNTGEPLVTISE